MSEYRQLDPEDGAKTLLLQIGKHNLMAISGFRFTVRDTGVTLPVGHGYRVTVDLAADDTYTVRRVFERGGKCWLKGQESGVYAEQLGDSAYRASCYVNVEFGEARV